MDPGLFPSFPRIHLGRHGYGEVVTAQGPLAGERGFERQESASASWAWACTGGSRGGESQGCSPSPTEPEEGKQLGESAPFLTFLASCPEAGSDQS